MRLLITEKPSVARDLAQVLGVRGRADGYFASDDLWITWCVGHLVELQMPAHYDAAWKRWSLDTLPMLPQPFALRVRSGVSDRWQVVRRLLCDARVREVINACDAGREGELIFRYAYQLAGCKAPVRRLWLASLTETAIRQGWEQLRPAEAYDNLGEAARCRSEADWLVGLNATRAMTCLARQSGGDGVLSVGRVQTPTLALVVARDREIEAFVPQTYWQVKATFEAEQTGQPVRWTGTWFAPKVAKGASERGATPASERLPEQSLAQAIVKAVTGQTGVLEHASRNRVVDKPPLLYDLTSLQRRANQRYGLSAPRTLEIAQALYERHKLISYPRTDARYITPDVVAELPGIVQGLSAVTTYQPHCQTLLATPIQPGNRVVNASEVGDHHAILPTGKDPLRCRLRPDEKRVFDLIARRLLAALSPDALFERTVLVVAVPPATELPPALDAPLRFRARGRVCMRAGWREVDPPKAEKERELPNLAAGGEAVVQSAKSTEGQTKPPKPHTDASLLYAMETAGRTLDAPELKRAMRHAGLGTPATRAAILQTLLKRQFLERKGRDICATTRGRALVDAVPDERLTSPMLTGQYEAKLAAIAEGRQSPQAFMEAVRAHVREVVDAIRTAQIPQGTLAEPPKGKVLGQCPVCKAPVRERRAVYACDTGRSCAFVVYKTMAKRSISARMVRTLLAKGKTKPVKGFKSKKGKSFSAGLVLREDGTVGFWFEGALAALPNAEPTADPVGLHCPSCGQGRLVAGNAAWGCSRWREGCSYRVDFSVGAEQAVAQVQAAGPVVPR